MMRLRTAKASPFGRKVWIAAARLDLLDRIEIIAANFMDARDPVHEENPLGKMPVLTTDAGEQLYDSRVIIDYLDHLVSGVILPADWGGRLLNLRLQALADGIMDAGVLIVMEALMRPKALQYQPFVEFQRRKIIRGLECLARALPVPSRVHVGAIAIACALGFLDRRRQFDWRAVYPSLIEWLDAFRAAAPEFDATAVAPEPGYVSL